MKIEQETGVERKNGSALIFQEQIKYRSVLTKEEDIQLLEDQISQIKEWVETGAEDDLVFQIDSHVYRKCFTREIREREILNPSKNFQIE